MRLIMVKGYSKTGKTTTCCKIIEELVRRGYSVASVKDIHFEGFAMDKENTDTWKHAQAGATTVTALGVFETDILYKRKLDIEEVLSHYTEDFVVLEGDSGVGCANIVTGKTIEQLNERKDRNTIGFSGIISESVSCHDGLPVIDGTKDVVELVNLIEERSTVR